MSVQAARPLILCSRDNGAPACAPRLEVFGCRFAELLPTTALLVTQRARPVWKYLLAGAQSSCQLPRSWSSSVRAKEVGLFSPRNKVVLFSPRMEAVFLNGRQEILVTRECPRAQEGRLRTRTSARAEEGKRRN